MTTLKQYNELTDEWETIVVGKQGPVGPSGPTGPQGSVGLGVPVGGATGQVLAKNSVDDYDTEWITVSGSGAEADDASLIIAAQVFS